VSMVVIISLIIGQCQCGKSMITVLCGKINGEEQNCPRVGVKVTYAYAWVWLKQRSLNLKYKYVSYIYRLRQSLSMQQTLKLQELITI